MKRISKTLIGVISIVVLSCIIMYIVEIYIKPGYLIKSLCKVAVFGILPVVYCAFDKSISLRDYFGIGSKKQLILSVGLGLGVYAFILGGFFAIRQFIDLNQISSLLSKNANITKDNFIYVALYISFINSLLEEFFFRGFAFLSIKKISSKLFAYIFSALAFSLYHIAILSNWFNTALFLVIISGLFVSGLIFNKLNENDSNIYNSWLVHMFANFAINTIGFMMFSML